MKSQEHRDKMLRRKCDRVYRSLKAKTQGVPDIDLRAWAMSEASGVPAAECKDQLVFWATGRRPEVPLLERCSYPWCESRASAMAAANGSQLCWPHVGEWAESPDAHEWRMFGASPETKPAFLAAFLKVAE